MFKQFRSELRGLTVALGRMAVSLRAHSEQPQGPAMDSDLYDRVSALEGRIESVLGIVEAGIIKVEAIKSTALAADERARGKLKRAKEYGSREGDPDSADEILEAYKALGINPNGNAEAGEAEEVYPVHPRLEASTPRALAVRAKFGV